MEKSITRHYVCDCLEGKFNALLEAAKRIKRFNVLSLSEEEMQREMDFDKALAQTEE